VAAKFMIFIGINVVGLSVRLFVRALKGKRLELSTPNFVHVYSIAVARHALTQRWSKGQRSRSHGHENRHGRTVASDACCYGRVLLLPAWVCMSIRLPPMFSSSIRNAHRGICFQHPYPSEDQKKDLSEQTGLTMSQVNNWYDCQYYR